MTDLGGNFTGLNPAALKLGALANNGGARLSHALALGSPIQDKGTNPGGSSTDVRGAGFLRDVGGVDIGAYENPVSFNVTNTNDSGAGSLRQALLNANSVSGSNTITFSSLFDTPRTITLLSTLAVSDGVVIRGPGMDKLTVRTNADIRLLDFDAAIGKVQTLNISGMTFADGDPLSPDSDGGAIRMQDESLIAIDVRFRNNAGYSGGAVSAAYSEVNPFMNFRDCIFEGNTGAYGGAVYSGGDRDVTFLNCSASGNTATGTGITGWGGVVCVNGDGGDLSITGCTFADNTAAIGGAVRTVHSGNVYIAESLFHDNSANAYGGAIAIHSWSDPGSWTIRNTTISNNTATTGGGAVSFASFFGDLDTLRLENCTITGNAGGSRAGGIHVYGDVSAESCIITGNTATTNPDAEVEDAVTLKNSAFGSTAGAVIVDDGGNFLGLTPTQAKLGALADNGGRLSHALAADSPLLNKGSNPAGGSNDARGTGFPRSANGGVDIGSYERNISFVVTNANNAGPGSLRQALADADSSGGTNDFITFDPTFFASPRTILLSEQIFINDAVEIIGPGAAFATITNPNQRAFWVNFDGVDGSTEQYKISGLSFVNNQGQADGGAIVGSYGTLSIRDCVFTGNGSSGQTSEGGALNAFRMDVSIDGCVFSNNKVSDEGGAVFARTGLTIRNTTFNNNTAIGDGGAIFLGSNGGNTVFDATIENTTISANVVGLGTGGGIGVRDGSGILRLRNSTVVGNAAKTGGGIGDGINAFLGVELVSSIVAYNTATGAGPDIDCSGVVTMKNSAVFSHSGFSPNDLGFNLAPGQDYKLGTLKDNGGLGKTHAPQTGSPLINAGTNPYGLSRDQRGGSHVRSVGTGVDIGAIEVQTAPRIVSVAVDTGTQRSLVRNLTVTFNRVVTLGTGAFDVVRTSNTGPSGTVPFTLDTSLSTPQQTIVKLTFSASSFTEFGSLIDGDYRLIVVAGQVSDGSGQKLDGDGNGTGGDSAITVFHRLFGDINGDRTVDGGTDFAAFSIGNLNATNAPFDFNNDGTIDGGTDFAEFGTRFGRTL